MDVAERHNVGKSVWDILFGLQLGVIGGVVMLAWFALVCPICRQTLVADSQFIRIALLQLA